MKRFGGYRHYLPSQVQSEQAAALKTTTLFRAVVCSHWLVIGREGALLGELCSPPVCNLFFEVHSLNRRATQSRTLTPLGRVAATRYHAEEKRKNRREK